MTCCDFSYKDKNEKRSKLKKKNLTDLTQHFQWQCLLTTLWTPDQCKNYTNVPSGVRVSIWRAMSSQLPYPYCSMASSNLTSSLAVQWPWPGKMLKFPVSWKTPACERAGPRKDSDPLVRGVAVSRVQRRGHLSSLTIYGRQQVLLASCTIIITLRTKCVTVRILRLH